MRIVKDSNGAKAYDERGGDALFGPDVRLLCPACSHDGRGEVVMAWLRPVEPGRWAIVAVAPSPWDGPSDLPTWPGEVLTDAWRERVWMHCPHPDCGRRFGSFTVAALVARMDAGRPLVASGEATGPQRQSGPQATP